MTKDRRCNCNDIKSDFNATYFNRFERHAILRCTVISCMHFTIVCFAKVCCFNDLLWKFNVILWDLYAMLWKIELKGLIIWYAVLCYEIWTDTYTHIKRVSNILKEYGKKSNFTTNLQCELFFFKVSNQFMTHCLKLICYFIFVFFFIFFSFFNDTKWVFWKQILLNDNKSETTRVKPSFGCFE